MNNPYHPLSLKEPLTFFIYLGISLAGETFQQMTRSHEREYDFLAGQLSDFGYAGFVTLLDRILPKTMIIPFGIGAASVLTLTEFSPTQTYDPKDIAAYWLGATSAMVVSSFKKRKTLEEKLHE